LSKDYNCCCCCCRVIGKRVFEEKKAMSILKRLFVAIVLMVASFGWSEAVSLQIGLFAEKEK